MSRLSRPGLWYLFDYGMVISTAPEPRDWLALQRATGLDLDLEAASSPYWTHREGFDAGTLTPAQYWSAVLGRTAGADEVRTLEALDAAQWAHLNPKTLSVLETLTKEGAQLALLSNMPAAMSRNYTATAQWPGLFSRLYFSGQLRMLKPDPRIFEYVAGDLGVPPRDIVFIDDNAANISAAQALGLQTVHHTGDTDLRAELAEVPR
ncbi:HAD family phosphatase [Arthrobacter jiangjiafuii]|uniref:HAD family phosphatase n=1 Tax=Arthrobacter jiangjiafuii TaxID=2817475 RepID=A0A975M7H1_9MICC|nr:HAD family phosphatase [Arthrobacter jiangjiafuii]MBP3044225.1 HAD family phosphatase [Arthrobacter jiangjiafuii]QWC11189.1 HAD family phosphatase [Arthrobacter jiangjiafuii]